MSYETAYNAIAQGEALLDIGRYAQAAELFRKAIAGAPDWSKPRCDLVSALMGLGELEQALEAAESAIACDPSDAWTHLRRAEVLIRLDRPGEAIESATEAVRTEPEDSSAHWVLSAARFAAGDLDAAAVAARASIEIDPSDAFPWRTLARISMREQRYGEAEERWRKALELDPTDAMSVNLLGDALKALGRHDDARSLYEQAARMDPASAVLRHDLVQANREFVNGFWLVTAVGVLIFAAVTAFAVGGDAGIALGLVAVLGLAATLAALSARRRRRTQMLTPASQILLRDQPWHQRNDFAVWLGMTIPVAVVAALIALLVHINEVGVGSVNAWAAAVLAAVIVVGLWWAWRGRR